MTTILILPGYLGFCLLSRDPMNRDITINQYEFVVNAYERKGTAPIYVLIGLRSQTHIIICFICAGLNITFWLDSGAFASKEDLICTPTLNNTYHIKFRLKLNVQIILGKSANKIPNQQAAASIQHISREMRSQKISIYGVRFIWRPSSAHPPACVLESVSQE
jgi:hypothetical protein